jgi:quercetin dioxygenase-like cupin family protein
MHDDNPQVKDKNMKNKTMLSLTFAFAIGLGLCAQAQDSKGFPLLNNGTSVSNSASHYTFHDTGARGTDGKTKIEFSDAFGTMTTGQHGTFFTFTPGFISPVHTHTYDYYAVVIKGEMENYEVGVTPIKMGPGSYWYQRGKKAHTTVCLSKIPCEIFIVQNQKFDAQVPPKEE